MIMTMRWLGPTFALLLVCPELRADSSRPVPSRPGLSWSEADSLVRKLEAIARRKGAPTTRPETVEVTEAELNSYLNLSLGPKMPHVTDVQVRLERERVSATGLVDLDGVKDPEVSSSSWSALSLLAGRVPVQLRARLLNQDGFGSLEWEEVRISSLPVPISVLEQLVVSLTRSPSNPQGFDIRAPFRLPYSVRRLRLEPGRALLDF